MTINPIIPIWAMAIISLVLLFPVRKGLFNYIRQVIIVLLIFAINLRPMVPNGESIEITKNYKVLFVVDNTISMFAEDYNGNETRKTGVDATVEHIITSLPGASFSAMKFDSEAKMLSPFSSDAGMTLQAIQVLNGQTKWYATGTTLNIVKDPLKAVLMENTDDCVIVFFISDGEITKDEVLQSFSELEPLVDGGAVLGFGTKEGGKMKAFSYTGDENEAEYLEYYDANYNKQIAVSKIDEKNLQKIASDLDIDYVHVTEPSQVDSILEKVNSEVENLMSEKSVSKSGYGEIYYYFVMALGLILCYEFVYYMRRTKIKGNKR